MNETMNETEIKAIHIADFDYPLPDGRIAKHPLTDRAACKLLAADNRGDVNHTVFSELPGFLSPDTIICCNDTRVINARIEMHKPTGSRIEIFLLEPVEPHDYVLMFQERQRCVWRCLVGNRKRWKEGELVKEIDVNGSVCRLRARILGEAPGNSFDIAFEWDGAYNWADIVEAAGRIPIPPYLHRESEESDTDDYQTVYARMQGSVAAPTAGLHFTDELMDQIRGRGIEFHPVTLHVGAGTFQPVKSEEIGEHPMHTEKFTVTPETLGAIIRQLEAGHSVTAIGTTSVRTLESLPYIGRHLLTGADNPYSVSQWEAYESEPFDTLPALKALYDRLIDSDSDVPASMETSIMIAPGFQWRIVSAMVTNFHQPQSTLLLLVSSFLGNDENGTPLWRGYYDRALENGYRFLSYGDACYFTRK